MSIKKRDIMAIKKIEHKEQKDWSSLPLLILDRVYFDPRDKKVYGDSCFYFEVSQESKTKDVDRLRSYAINGIVIAREGGENNWIYLLNKHNTREEKGRVFEAVVATEDATEEFLAAIKEVYGENIKITSVPEKQLLVSFPVVDESMVQYKKEHDAKEKAAYLFIESVLKMESGEKFPLKPFRVFEQDINSISWHVGLDGETYFNLGYGNGQETCGMSEERLVEFLDNASLVDVENLSSSFRKSKGFSPDIEELLYYDLTVGGCVLDRSLVYQCTKDFNDAQMASLKTNLQTRLEEFYDNLMADHLMGEDDCKRAKAAIDKDINSRLGHWPLLAGKMDHQLDEAKFSHGVTGNDIARIAGEAFRVHPEYRKIIFGWCKNRCEENGLSAKYLPVSLLRKLSNQQSL